MKLNKSNRNIFINRIKMIVDTESLTNPLPDCKVQQILHDEDMTISLFTIWHMRNDIPDGRKFRIKDRSGQHDQATVTRLVKKFIRNEKQTEAKTDPQIVEMLRVNGIDCSFTYAGKLRQHLGIPNSETRERESIIRLLNKWVSKENKDNPITDRRLLRHIISLGFSCGPKYFREIRQGCGIAKRSDRRGQI